MSEQDLKCLELTCPLCGSKMSILPLCRAASCTKCITRLPLEQVERIRVGLSVLKVQDSLEVLKKGDR